MQDIILYNKRLNENLKNLRKMLGADRIWVAKFHNGNIFSDGENTLRISITNEAVGPGIDHATPVLHNVLVAPMSDIMQEVSEHGVAVRVPLCPTGILCSYLKMVGTENVYLFKIPDMDDEMVAVLGVSFMDKNKKLHNEEIKEMKSRANQLSGYIRKDIEKENE